MPLWRGQRQSRLFAGGYIPELIVSEAYAEKLMGETFTELVDVVYEEPFSEETEKAVKAVFAGGESAVSTTPGWTDTMR